MKIILLLLMLFGGEIQALENMANLSTDAGIARWKARSILNFFYGYNFEDEPILPELAPALRTMQTDSTEQTAKEEPIVSTPQLTVNPNPAKSWVKFTYNLAGTDKAELLISDVNGKTLYTTALTTNAGELIWEVPNNFSAGIYFAVLKCRGQSPLVQKFVIIN